MPEVVDQDQFNIESIKFGKDGLVPAVAQDCETREVLMMAWMDAEAVQRTLRNGLATYWSRSRKSYWVKGETSGNFQKLVELRIDCDLDCLLLLVEQKGNACHTGRRSCFYRSLRDNALVEIQ